MAITFDRNRAWLAVLVIACNSTKEQPSSLAPQEDPPELVSTIEFGEIQAQGPNEVTLEHYATDNGETTIVGYLYNGELGRFRVYLGFSGHEARQSVSLAESTYPTPYGYEEKGGIEYYAGGTENLAMSGSVQLDLPEARLTFTDIEFDTGLRVNTGSVLSPLTTRCLEIGEPTAQPPRPDPGAPWTSEEPTAPVIEYQEDAPPYDGECLELMQ